MVLVVRLSTQLKDGQVGQRRHTLHTAQVKKQNLQILIVKLQPKNYITNYHRLYANIFNEFTLDENLIYNLCGTQRLSG